jgi:penicillin-binding protein 2
LEQKFKFLAGLVMIIFGILLVRIWFLQIMEGAANMVKSREIQTRKIKINAPRGIFYDRNGRILATSRYSHNVSVVPNDIKKKPEVLSLLSRILKVPEEALQEKLKPDPRFPPNPYQYMPIAKDVDLVTVMKLLEAKFDLPGVEVDEVPVRLYPFGEFACHLFGYIREINPQELSKLKDKYGLGDIIGKSGLERTYEQYLRGIEGGKIFEVDIHGRPSLLENRDPVPGDNLRLTIDQKVQAAAEKALLEQLASLPKYTKWHNAKSGTVIVLDPRNGNILAMVSEPGFDPNIFVGVISEAMAQKLYQNKLNPTLNRAIQGEFAPGSTFKPITVYTALMEGKVTIKDRFYCNGYDSVWGKKLPCWIAKSTTGPREHGLENVSDGLKNSCNAVMAELSRRVGADKLAEYARFFGLGRPTGLYFYPSESYGLVPDPEWKRQNKKELWYPVESGQLAIGQNALTVTPLQLAEVYAAFATNGKIYQPRLVSAITKPSGEAVARFKPQLIADLRIPPAVKDIIQQGLQEVVDIGGTASAAFIGFPLKEIPVAGKTGTVQNPPRDDNGIFACYAPADKPEIVVIVLIEQGGSGSGVAAPVGRKILEAYFEAKLKKIMGAGNESWPTNLNPTVPSSPAGNNPTPEGNNSGAPDAVKPSPEPTTATQPVPAATETNSTNNGN